MTDKLNKNYASFNKGAFFMCCCFRLPFKKSSCFLMKRGSVIPRKLPFKNFICWFIKRGVIAHPSLTPHSYPLAPYQGGNYCRKRQLPISNLQKQKHRRHHYFISPIIFVKGTSFIGFLILSNYNAESLQEGLILGNLFAAQRLYSFST